MRQTNLRYVFLLLLLAVILSGCGQSTSNSQTPCDTPSQIRGNVVTISPFSSGSQSLGSIFVDGTKEKQKAQFDKVYVSVQQNTQVFERKGQACNAISFGAMRVGQRIQVQSTGIVRQSYPAQIDAITIVILPPETP